MASKLKLGKNPVENADKAIKLTDLGDSSYALVRPIKISLTFAHDEVSAEWAEVGLHEDSGTEKGAVKELKKAIRDLYDDIADRPDEKLGGYMLSYKKILNKAI